ncbi:hypothetical protein TNCV_4470051 [Trichonephila clavipes]|nr:hypothetical protein TNCV_4470051 [Trichonephila clavipes]
MAHNQWTKTLEKYQSVFKLPSIRIRDVRIVHPMLVRNHTRSKVLGRYRMEANNITPFSYQGYVIQCTRVIISLCVLLTTEVDSTAVILPNATVNVFAPYAPFLDKGQTSSFPDEWSVMWLYGFAWLV